MSQSRGKRSRLLGQVRHSLTGIEAIPKLPPLTPSIDRTYEGIHGNAMSVPSQRDSPERDDIRKTKTPRSPQRRLSLGPSEESRSDESVTDKQNLKDALSREKQLQGQIASQQKVIESLKSDIQDKVKVIKELQEQLLSQEEHYRSLYEQEVCRHGDTRSTLSEVQEELALKDDVIADLKLKHDAQLKLMDEQMEQRIIMLRKEKEAEIMERDEKLKKLKRHMADALRGNSWERQQQLDELSKELTRAQAESDQLRAKLKSIAKNGKGGPGNCTNCDTLSTKVQQLSRTVQDKDRAAREAKTLCSKFEKQLAQQDEVLRLYGDHRATKPK